MASLWRAQGLRRLIPAHFRRIGVFPCQKQHFCFACSHLWSLTLGWPLNQDWPSSQHHRFMSSKTLKMVQTMRSRKNLSLSSLRMNYQQLYPDVLGATGLRANAFCHHLLIVLVPVFAAQAIGSAARLWDALESSCEVLGQLSRRLSRPNCDYWFHSYNFKLGPA